MNLNFLRSITYIIILFILLNIIYNNVYCRSSNCIEIKKKIGNWYLPLIL